MSAGADSVRDVNERWSRDQVLGLAPDAASRKAAAGVARPAKWYRTGCDGAAVWGECQGSGKTAYRTCADLSGPAFRCSCPSRKFPCKHALGLLILWSDGAVGDGTAPDWVAGWRAERRDRAERARARRAMAAGGSGTSGDRGTSGDSVDPGVAPPDAAKDPKTAERRERRVADGVDELDLWLCDQVGHGLAGVATAPYTLWDDVARRLVDAQAGGLAGRVRELASIPRRGDGWPSRLLEEYALLRLLATAYRRRDVLPEPLRATVRARVGFTVTQEAALAGERVHDRWYVAGIRDDEQEHLTTRRVWLRGLDTGRPALVLSFAAPGRTLDASLVAGGTVDAELAFHPGAQPLRAVVAARHGTPTLTAPRGTTVAGLLGEYAGALARDPWLDRWPALLERVRPARAGSDCSHLVDEHGDALPLRAADPWRLLAVSGGRPLTVAGEWTPDGLVPLSACPVRNSIAACATCPAGVPSHAIAASPEPRPNAISL